MDASDLGDDVTDFTRTVSPQPARIEYRLPTGVSYAAVEKALAAALNELRRGEAPVTDDSITVGTDDGEIVLAFSDPAADRRQGEVLSASEQADIVEQVDTAMRSIRPTSLWDGDDYELSADEAELLGYDSTLRGLDGRDAGAAITWRALTAPQQLKLVIAYLGETLEPARAAADEEDGSDQ